MRNRERSESALVVPVMAVEPIVATWRRRLDPAARLGVPAHVTILYPFLEPHAIGDSVVATLGQVARSVPSFAVRFASVGWFGKEVLWLAPEPASGFLDLVWAAVGRWSELRPYGGAHREIVPHLTVGQDAPIEQLETAAAAVSAALPVEALVNELWLMTGGPTANSWSVRASVALGSVR